MTHRYKKPRTDVSYCSPSKGPHGFSCRIRTPSARMVAKPESGGSLHTVQVALGVNGFSMLGGPFGWCATLPPAIVFVRSVPIVKFF
jgi:hypothetical protein